MSVPEAIVAVLIGIVHGVAGVLAFVQVIRRRQRYRSVLWWLVLGGVLLDAVLLGVRAVRIGAVPLTDTYEACVFLALVFGVLYLGLSRALDRVWFDSIMVWIVVVLALGGLAIARPAGRAAAVASTPWAVGHAIAMVLAAAAIMFAAGNSALSMVSRYCLKRKQVGLVLGRMPNMETLEGMNRLGLVAGFALLTVGLVTGVGLVSSLGTGLRAWITDGKVICVVAAWGLLGVSLALDRLSMLNERCRACVSLIAFALVLFAILGVAVVGITQHEFSLGFVVMNSILVV